MALTRAEQQRAKAFLLSLPAKRGVDIPAEEYDKLYHIASGITLPMWGRPPHPTQLQHLWDNHLTEPAQIHAAFNSLPHPHAPNVSVGEFPAYAQAFTAHEQHSK